MRIFYYYYYCYYLPRAAPSTFAQTTLQGRKKLPESNQSGLAFPRHGLQTVHLGSEGQNQPWIGNPGPTKMLDQRRTNGLVKGSDLAVSGFSIASEERHNPPWPP